MAQKISDCCGAAVTNPIMLDLGICPDCRDHCDFVNEDDDSHIYNDFCNQGGIYHLIKNNDNDNQL